MLSPGSGGKNPGVRKCYWIFAAVWLSVHRYRYFREFNRYVCHRCGLPVFLRVPAPPAPAAERERECRDGLAAHSAHPPSSREQRLVQALHLPAVGHRGHSGASPWGECSASQRSHPYATPAVLRRCSSRSSWVRRVRGDGGSLGHGWNVNSKSFSH